MTVVADSTYPATLAEALARFQAEIPDVVKAETAEVTGESKDGRPVKYKYTYADLAACTRAGMPLLGKYGLSFSAKPTLLKDGQFVLVYKLRHISGDFDGGQWPLPDPTRTKPQQIGSAITYARRYAFCSVTGLAPKDDDDAAAADAEMVPEQQYRRERPAARSADDRQAEVNDEQVEANYQSALADATALPELNRVGAWITGDQRLDRAARQRLRQQFDARIEALSKPSSDEATDAVPAEAAGS